MTTLREAAQQALEAWEHINKYGFVLADYEGPMEQAITALKAALEQPEQAEPWVKSYCGGKPNYTTPAEQKPVAWIQSNHLQLAQRGPFSCRVEPTQRHPDFVPLYTHPPRREWRGLTEEEIQSVIQLEREKRFQRRPPLPLSMTELSHAIEAKLKEKNHE